MPPIGTSRFPKDATANPLAAPAQAIASTLWSAGRPVACVQVVPASVL
jgi:hypothetical protein